MSLTLTSRREEAAVYDMILPVNTSLASDVKIDTTPTYYSPSKSYSILKQAALAQNHMLCSSDSPH
jgi:hypothetical protein